MIIAAADTGDLRPSSDFAALSGRPLPGSLFADLAKKIQEAGQTVRAVCQTARVAESHYYEVRAGTKVASRWWIRRCELALEQLLGGLKPAEEPSDHHVLLLYRAFLSEAARHYGLDIEEAARARQGEAAKARHLAIYLVNTELAVRQASLARLFGLTRSAISQAIEAVEDRREDAGFDKAVAAMGRRITGRT